MICLIRPPATEMVRFSTGSVVPPLGLAYIAGTLERENFPLQVIDSVSHAPTQYFKYYRGFCIGLRVEEIVEEVSPETQYIGITVTFTHEWPLVSALTRLLKKRFPHVPIILGGEHVTALSTFSLETSYADYIVLGEGEETIVELLRELMRGNSTPQIEGVSYRSEGGYYMGKRRKRNANIDDIALPAWQFFNLEAYHKHRLVGGLYSPDMTIPLLATRGCPYQCTFCGSPNMWTTKWMARDPKQVVDEIEFYSNQYGAKNFPFHDSTAIVKKDWIVQFCQELIRRNLNIQWQLPTGTRSEAIDEEVAHLLVQSGMKSISYAPESGSDETRKIIKKRVVAENMFESVRAANKAGLSVSTFMLIGFPHETPKLLSENLPFVKRLLDIGVDDMSICFYVPIPGTELFHHLVDTGQLRLDRSYFRKILSQQSLVPETSFCTDVDRWGLAAWKIRIFAQFYFGLDRLGKAVRTSVNTLKVIFSAAKTSGDESKLQTAVRNAFSRSFGLIKSLIAKPWLDRNAETQLFKDWDVVFERLRSEAIEQKAILAAPRDAKQLGKTRLIDALPREHREAFVLTTRTPLANKLPHRGRKSPFPAVRSPSVSY